LIYSASSCEPKSKGKDGNTNNAAVQISCKTFNVSSFEDAGIIIGKHPNETAASISAVAAAFIAWFTWTIKQINNKQLARTEDVERAYMSAGGSRQPPRQITEEERIKAGLPPPSGNTVYLTQSEWFQFDVNNHGKTPGEIIEYGYGWCAVDRVANLPEFPNYRWVQFRDQIGPGTQSRGIKRIKISDDKPVIYGRIGYKDIFGKRHSHGFMQEIGKPIAPPHPSYIETDPEWDVPNVGDRSKRDYQDEEPQS